MRTLASNFRDGLETNTMIVCTDTNVINAGPEGYVTLVEDAIHERRAIPQPLTIPQLQALAEVYPDIARPLLPPPAELSRLGLSKYTCREIPLLSLEWRERFITTMSTDTDFRTAVAELLIGGGE